jgi:hypothetical protein
MDLNPAADEPEGFLVGRFFLPELVVPGKIERVSVRIVRRHGL